MVLSKWKGLDYAAVYGFKNGGILLMGTIWLNSPVAYGLCCIHNFVNQEHAVGITTDAASLQKLDEVAVRNEACERQKDERNGGPAGTRQGEDILGSCSSGVSAHTASPPGNATLTQICRLPFPISSRPVSCQRVLLFESKPWSEWVRGSHRGEEKAASESVSGCDVIRHMQYYNYRQNMMVLTAVLTAQNSTRTILLTETFSHGWYKSILLVDFNCSALPYYWE